MLDASRPGGQGSAPYRAALIPSLGIACSAAIVFHGALRYFFSQDDFGWLAQARGLIPRDAGPYRYLSTQLYYDLMRPLAGERALPYHLVSLGLHAIAGVMVFAFLRRRVSAPAAWLAAAFFVAHPAMFTALYWISATGDLLALVFALGAAMTARAAGALRWLALPLFASSLLSKESTVLLPLWIVAARILAPSRPADAADPERGARWKRILDPLLPALVVVSAIYLAWFLVRGISGTGSVSAASPYAMAFDRTVWLNLLSYLGWTVNFLYPTVHSFADAVDAKAFVPGGVALALWLGGLAWRPLRDRGWLLAGLWVATFLLPVLPLRNHTYHYYLYAPMAGTAWCLAALADALFARRGGARDAAAGGLGKAARRKTPAESPRPRRPTTAWAMAIALGAALTLNGAMLVHKIEIFPFIDPALRADPVVDRARIARNVVDGLSAASLPPGTRLIFWSPDLLARDPPGHDPAVESYWERNVRSALYDGVAVRVLFPEVASVEFVRTFRSVDNSTLYALYGVDGRLRLVSPAELDSVRRAHSGSPKP